MSYEIAVADKLQSEYFAAPAALLTLEPHLPCLAGLTKADLAGENWLEVADPTILVHQYSAAMQTIGQHVPTISVGNLSEWPHHSQYQKLVAKDPNAMFARDFIGAAAPWMSQIVMAKMELAGRKAEPLVAAQALASIGAEVVQLGLSKHDTLEGGDVIPASFDGKKTLLVGISERTTEGAAKALYNELGEAVDQIVMVYHPSEILHLDTGLTLYAGPETGPGAAVVADGMFQSATLLDKHNPAGGKEIDMHKFLGSHGFQIVPVSAADAIKQEVCNVLALSGGTYIGFDAMSQELTDKISGISGATILTARGDEITKATGGLHCLTHQLYGQAVLDYVKQEGVS